MSNEPTSPNGPDIVVSDIIVHGVSKELRVQKRGIFVVTLCGHGSLRSEQFMWREFLMELSQSPEHPYYYRWAQVVNANTAALAHNVACDTFLQVPEYGDYIWIWAHDMVPKPSTLRLLEVLDMGADIATPTVHIWSEKEKAPLIVSGNEVSEEQYEVWNIPRQDGPYAVNAAGTGGMLIHRRVLEHPSMALTPRTVEDPTEFFKDTYFPGGRRRHGHDLDFSRRATRLGFKMITHPGALAGHRKELDLLEVAEYAERYALIAAQDRARVWTGKLREIVQTCEKDDIVAAFEKMLSEDLSTREEAGEVA